MSSVGSIGVITAVVFVGVSSRADEAALDRPMPPLLDLATAQGVALDGNPTLLGAAARVRQAEARVRRATAAYFPRIGVRGSYRYTDLSASQERTIDRLLNPLDDEDFDRLEEATDDIVSELRDAGQRATDRVQQDLLDDLSGRPGLQRLTTDVFDLRNRIRDDFNAAVDDELGDFSVVDRVRESLELDEPRVVDDTQETYRVGVDGTWLLFDGFARTFSRAIARYGAEESEVARRDAQRLLLGAVAEAYYEAQLARAEVAIAQADLDFNARLLNDAEKSNEAGKGSLSAVLNFQVRENAAATALAESQFQYRTGLIGLAALMGFPTATIPAGVVLAPLEEERSDQLHPPDEDARILHAMSHRPDLVLARTALERTESGIRLTRSAFSPTLTLSGGYGATRDDTDFRGDDFGGTVAAVLNFDVFEGGARRAQVAEAMGLRDEAAYYLVARELDVAAEVRTTISTLRSAGDILRLETRNAELVERMRDLVELEYKGGRASLTRLNEAQRDLVRARSRHATALAALHVAWHKMLQATGESLAEVGW